MGSPRRRARHSLPRARPRRNADGPVGLCTAGDVAPVRRAADRRYRGPGGLAVASRGAQPGRRALRGCVPRARGELACVRTAVRARGHVPRACRRCRCRVRRTCRGGLPPRTVVFRPVGGAG